MNKRTSRIDVRLTKKERAALQKLANKQGVTVSDWFRHKIAEESEPQSNLLGETHFRDVPNVFARWFDLK